MNIYKSFKIINLLPAKSNNAYNLIDGSGNLVFKEYKYFIYISPAGILTIYSDDANKRFFYDLDLCDKVFSENSFIGGIERIICDNHKVQFTLIDNKGNRLDNMLYDNIDITQYKKFIVVKDDKSNIADNKGTILSDEWYDSISPLGKYYKVKNNSKVNALDDKCKLISPDKWFSEISLDYDENWEVYFKCSEDYKLKLNGNITNL